MKKKLISLVLAGAMLLGMAGCAEKPGASEKPLFLEIFTKMDEDAEKTNEFYDMYRQTKDKWDNSVKQIVKSIVPEKKIKKMKQIVNILKEKE